MVQVIFSRNELIQRTGVSEEQLDALERAGVFQPAGKTGGETPVYDQESLHEIPKILALLEVGYSHEEVRRILKKVGLPRSRRRKARRTVPFLTVGELAQRADLSTRTIKHWEEKGIFEAESRTDGGFRLYPEIYVLFCHLIKDLQNFGYKLEEIKEVADMFRDFHRISQDLDTFGQEVAEAKLKRMLERIGELRRRTADLKSGIKRWEEYASEKSKEIDRLLGQIRKRQQQVVYGKTQK